MSSAGQIDGALTVCALRFDGYAYEGSVRGDRETWTGGILGELVEPIVETLTLHPVQEANLAAFFGLQRYLCKWGGERLGPESPEHVAYGFLFLHLYRAEIPTEFMMRDYVERWDRDYRDRVEPIASMVRTELLKS